MSTSTAENILKLIEELPTNERARLQQMLAQAETAPVKAKAPRDKRVPCEPMPDDKLERQWVQDHKHEYPGQWVALDGDRLIAASANRMEISAAVKADSAKLPLILHIPSPDDLPFMGI